MGGGGGWRGLLTYEIGIYVPHRVKKNGGGALGSGPSLKMVGFQSSYSREKRDIGAKNNKETYIVLKRSFLSIQVGKPEPRIVYFLL